MAADDFAVIVGIDRYPGLTPLNGAMADALAFRDWAVSDGGVPAANVLLVVTRDFADPAAPTELDVDRRFLQLCDLGEERGRIGRRLWVFLAGHGIAQNLHEASLLTANAEDGRYECHIPSRTYCDWFVMADYFEEVVLFVDCCRTNETEVRVRPFPRPPIQGASAGSGKWVYAFASRFGQSSLEAEELDRRGVFAQALLQGLRGGARGPDGKVTTRSLKDFLIAHPRLLKLQGKQDPELVAPVDLELASYSEGDHLLTLVAPPSGAEALVRGGPASLMLQLPATAPGRYQVRLARGIYAFEREGKKAFFEVTGAEEEVNVPLG